MVNNPKDADETGKEISNTIKRALETRNDQLNLFNKRPRRSLYSRVDQRNSTKELEDLNNEINDTRNALELLKKDFSKWQHIFNEQQDIWGERKKEYDNTKRSLKEKELVVKNSSINLSNTKNKIIESYEGKISNLEVEHKEIIDKMAQENIKQLNDANYEKRQKYNNELHNLKEKLNSIEEIFANNGVVLNSLKEDISKRYDLEKVNWLKKFDEDRLNKTIAKNDISKSIKDLDLTINNDLIPIKEVRQVRYNDLKLKNADSRIILNEKEKEHPGIRSKIQDIKKKINDLESDFTKYSNDITDYQAFTTNIKDEMLDEEKNRRILHNNLQDLRGNIRVYCRIKPLALTEPTLPINYMKVHNFNNNDGLQSLSVQKNINSYEVANYTFDKVFDQDSTNDEVFTEISELIQSSLDGYKVCIFAYGQTGSGKTFTMQHPGDGVIPQTLTHIFDWLDASNDTGWEYTIKCRFVEIYNDQVYDLLRDEFSEDNTLHAMKHKIHHDSTTHRTEIDNIKVFELTSKASTEKVLRKANKLRATATTKYNERSSRSHSIFIIDLYGKNIITGETRNGVLNLVDLAGSERLDNSKAHPDRLKETQHINKSLSFLGNVIHSLGSKDAATRHISFRDSKLTYLLQYSLTGDSKTLMFVNISAEKKYLGETNNSLMFASKVNSTKIVKR